MADNADATTIVAIVLIVLNIVTVAGRFYSRWFTKAGFEWDDWMILIATLSGFLTAGLTVWAGTISETGPAAASNFDPSYVFTPEDILYTKITFVTGVTYFFVTSTTKISLLLLYKRIFAIRGSFRIQIYVTIAVVVGFCLGSFLGNMLNCIPLEWTWNNGEADPRYCINYNHFWFIMGIIEAVIDVVILALPIGMVYKLHLNRKKKYGVSSIFLLGAFVLVSGIAKVILSYVHNSRQPDFGAAALWTAVHTYTGIICANLPPMWPLFNKMARGSLGNWVTMSSLRQRWYSLSGGKSSADRSTNPEISLGSSGRRHGSRPGDVEAGQADYELSMYGHNHGSAMGRGQEQANGYWASKSDGNLSINSRTRISEPLPR